MTAHDSWVFEGGLVSCSCGYSGPGEGCYICRPGDPHAAQEGCEDCHNTWRVDYAAGRSLVEVAQVIYDMHGCSCDEHETNGHAASCRRWRRKQAGRIATALLAVGNPHVGHRDCRPDLMLDGICADCQRPHRCDIGGCVNGGSAVSPVSEPARNAPSAKDQP